MSAEQVSFNPRSPEKADLMATEQWMSALVDGELGAAQLSEMLAAENGHEETLGRWHAYQVIGDVLRGHHAVVTPQASGDFLAGVRERLRSEPMPVASTTPEDRRLHAPGQPVTLVRGGAANDAVFRWKLVAGFASLAAVMAVSWTVLSGAPAAVGGPAGPQLAAAPALEAPAPAVAQVAEPSSAVVVNTGQGPLIRDARLEELLAEHRQNGSMSALQMPTGFIRNATYDAAGR